MIKESVPDALGSRCEMEGTMKIRVDLGDDLKIVSIRENATVEETIRSLGLLPDAHIILRNGIPIPITECLKDEETIRVVKVASGG